MIKKYIEFIKEDVFLKEDIRDYFIELIDEGYVIDTKDILYTPIYDNGKAYYDYSEQVLPNSEYTKGVEITIEKSTEPTEKDLTDVFLFGVNMLSDLGEVDLSDDYETTFRAEDISLKDGNVTLKGTNEFIIYLYLNTKELVTLNAVEAAKYNEIDISSAIVEDGRVFLSYTLEEIAVELLENHELITNLNYESSYSIDYMSLFDNYLNKENFKKLVTIMVDNISELTIEAIEKNGDMNKEEVIDYLMNERFYSILTEYAIFEDKLNEIINLVYVEVDDATFEGINKIILEEFNKKLGELVDYKIVNGDYLIEYTEHIDNYEYEAYIDTLFRTFFSENMIVLEPDLPDYYHTEDIDLVKLNKEIKKML